MKVKLLLVFIVICYGCKSSTEYIYERSYNLLEGTEVSLEELKANKYNVFIAFANNCPVCKASIPVIKQVASEYKEVGIVLFYPANQRDNRINDFISSLLPEKVFQVKDKNKFLTETFKAVSTPQAFIVDNKGKVHYQGAVNNSVFTSYRKNYTKEKAYLLNALDTLITLNKPLKQHETKAVGCFIE